MMYVQNEDDMERFLAYAWELFPKTGQRDLFCVVATKPLANIVAVNLKRTVSEYRQKVGKDVTDINQLNVEIVIDEGEFNE